MTSLSYLLTTSLYLLLFYSCYALLLRRNTFFSLNRAYLLISLGLALVLPFIELPAETTNALPVGSLTLPTFVIGSSQLAETDAITTIQWIWLVYGLGVMVMLVRLGLNLLALFRLIKLGAIERNSGFILVHLPNNSTPSFSFGPYLVLNQTDSLTQPDALMRHEEAHIRQRHTVDVLFLELIRAAFWFNPVLLFYKRALQELHEFLADQAVLKTPQPDYPQQLVAYALNVSPASLITPFASKSTLKQRIIMLQKPQTHRRALLAYALVLPLAAGLLMCTQSESDQPQSQTALTSAQTSARKNVKIDGEVFTVVEQHPEFPGGMKELSTYLGQNLKYPEAAEKANAQGRVFISFIVTKTGEITDVNLLKGIGFGADEEAMRVVRQMPRWKPGRQNGLVVNVKYNLPINFQLEEDALRKEFYSDLGRDYPTYLVNGKKVSSNEYVEAIKLVDSDKDVSEISFDKGTKTVSISLQPKE
jgi:TonB family protein